ncbi:MAG: DEAD/DEAH box helicase [Muribaculum sp.]|nr:DEAD/DEAH box helicase [Muribaculum sp.]
MKFDELFESDDMLDALWDMHFDECTPIQEMAIPPVLEGRDLLACAQTGTGKTAAYLLPVIDMIADGNYPIDAVNCVIMAPTRELAQQIDQQLQGFSYYVPVSGMAVYGGTDGKTYEQQRKSLKMGADIVIATPGRLLAHLSMGYVDLSKVSFFILDEADRMLDMGFFDDIMQIIGRLPKDRQTLLFSATMPPKIQQLASKILSNPVEIKLAVSKPADKIAQSAYILYETQKMPLLKEIFKSNPPRRAIVFSSSKIKCKELARNLKIKGISIGEMHSDLEQTRREEIMLKFKAGNINVLVATDIVARGIDVDDIDLVVNYDVPHEAEDYVHRVGRTARAERDGSAITFVNEKEQRKFRNIERLLEMEVPKASLPESIGQGPDYQPAYERKRSRRKSSSKNKTKESATPKKNNIPQKQRKSSESGVPPKNNAPRKQRNRPKNKPAQKQA